MNMISFSEKKSLLFSTITATKIILHLIKRREKVEEKYVKFEIDKREMGEKYFMKYNVNDIFIHMYLIM